MMTSGKASCGRAIWVFSSMLFGADVAVAANIPSDDSFGTWDDNTHTYTLTTNLAEAIVIDGDNFTLDGAGHTVSGQGSGNGVSLSYRSAVILRNLHVDGFGSGIYLQTSSGNIFENNTVSGSDVGFFMRGESGGNTVRENNFAGNGNGIHAELCTGTDNAYVNNDLSNSTGAALRIANTTQFTVTGNNFANSAGGIRLVGMDGLNVSDLDIDLTTITGGWGIYLVNSTNCSITDISVPSKSGIAIVGGGGNLISNVDASWIGAGPAGWGIALNGTTGNTIQNSASVHHQYGVYMVGADGNHISGMDIQDAIDGFHLNPSSDNTFENNTVSGSVIGFYMRSESIGNTVRENNFSGNGNGIHAQLNTGSDNAYVDNDLSNSSGAALRIGNTAQFTVSGNNFASSARGILLVNMDGVTLSESDVDLSTLEGAYGIYLVRVTNAAITGIDISAASGILLSGGGGNLISGVDVSGRGGATYGYGLQLGNSSNNTIEGCTIADLYYGIYLSGSSNNRIYNNSFIDNLAQAQVLGGSGNLFNLDRPTGGNYWSNWTSPDADNDGFVDDPFTFSGGQDDLPWTSPAGWQNQPPLADAGPDQAVEATSPAGATVSLNGLGSSDPDGDALSYGWSAPGIVFGDPTSSGPVGAFPLGETEVTLTVHDPDGASSTDVVLITVVDTTPPVLAIATEVAYLWPPNHKYQEIGLSIQVTDIADPSVSVTGTAVSSEPDDAKGNGDGKTSGDIRVTLDDGTALLSSNTLPEVALAPQGGRLELRAERSGGSDGRIYTITVIARDVSGNTTTAAGAVTVRHDQGNAKPLVLAGSPMQYALHPSAPNPFNPSTTIRFDLLQPEFVQLIIYDALGREVQILTEGYAAAGSHQVEWNGTDGSGRPAGSGVYFARLAAGGYSAVRRMLLLR